MQFLGSTWRAGTPPMTVPARRSADEHERRGLRGGRRRRRARGRLESGRRDRWRGAVASRERSAGRLPACGLRLQPAPTGTSTPCSRRRTEYRGAFAPGARAAPASFSPGPSRTSAASPTTSGPPTDRGGSVQDMQSREPAGTTCDCSMFVRWALAQAGIDIGLTTSTQWTANGLLPPGDTPQATAAVVARRRLRPARRAATSPPT